MKVLAASVALSFAWLADLASACTCDDASFARQLDRVAVVALVRIVETRAHADLPDRRDPLGPGAGPVLAKYELIETLKGDASSIAELESGYGGGDCGVPLLPGLHYLVLVNPEGRIARVSRCSGAMEFGTTDPREGQATIRRLRLDAARNYLRDRMPIDPCLERGFLFDRGIGDDECNRHLRQKMSEGSGQPA